MELKIFLVIMIIFAILAVFSNTLKTSVIFLGILSLTSALVYMFLNAPDVAMVEAVIGSVLTTILFLVAIQKCKILTVYYSSLKDKYSNYTNNTRDYRKIMRDIRSYCNSNELELQIVYTNENAKHFLSDGQKDILVIESEGGLSIYAQCNKESVKDLENSILKNHPQKISCIYYKKES